MVPMVNARAFWPQQIFNKSPERNRLTYSKISELAPQPRSQHKISHECEEKPYQSQSLDRATLIVLGELQGDIITDMIGGNLNMSSVRREKYCQPNSPPLRTVYGSSAPGWLRPRYWRRFGCLEDMSGTKVRSLSKTNQFFLKALISTSSIAYDKGRKT